MMLGGVVGGTISFQKKYLFYSAEKLFQIFKGMHFLVKMG